MEPEIIRREDGEPVLGLPLTPGVVVTHRGVPSPRTYEDIAITIALKTVTIEKINSRIVAEYQYKLAEKTTAVVLVLENGFEVTGVSACVSAENYVFETGVKIAKEKAIEQLWALEGYLLQEDKYRIGRGKGIGPREIDAPGDAHSRL